MITKLFKSIFRLSQNCGPQGQKLAKFSSFSRLSNIVSENLHYLVIYYSYENSKNAIRKKIKFRNR